MNGSPLAVYQAYLDKGELAYQWSPEANRAVFYPRVICPFTGSERLEWRVSAGLGTVYATTVTHPREGAPYNVALIACDEGFRLMSRVEDIAPEAIKIGMRVKLRVHRPGGDEPPYPGSFHGNTVNSAFGASVRHRSKSAADAPVRHPAAPASACGSS
jgi:uncharacterized OB-fold protein